MSVGEVLWTIFLTGLPFSHMLDRRLDIWHGHTAWAHLWLILLTAWTLYRGQTRTVPNRPLGAWMAWILVWSWYGWTDQIAANHNYAVQMLMPTLHLLSVILFYWAAVNLLSVQSLERLMRWMARVAVVVMGYCLLQLANLDQFFTSIDSIGHRDLMVGTIGNPTHLATYLALCIPIFLIQRGWRWKFAALLAGGLIILSGSAGGLVAGFCAAVWCLWFSGRKYALSLCAAGVLGAVILARMPNFLNPYGRLQSWAIFWEMFTKKPITGFGPGFIMEMSKQITEGPLFHWRHCHNEYLQVAIEQGVIGLSFVLWGIGEVIWRVRRLPKLPSLVALGGIGIAFLINALVNFPCHLWLLSSFGLLAYSGIYIHSSESQTDALVS